MMTRRLSRAHRGIWLVAVLAGVLAAGMGGAQKACAQADQGGLGGDDTIAAMHQSHGGTRGSTRTGAQSSRTVLDSTQSSRIAAMTDPVTEAAREYERTGIARTVDAGASITFPYGHSQPTVTCAPLRACVIELDTGESILSRIAGDTQRWEIELAPAGVNGRTPLVVVKPHDCGLTTNLVLTTTAGRVYDLTLDSPQCAHGGLNPRGLYARHVRFYYPDAMVRAWVMGTTAPPRAPMPATVVSADAFNFAYHIQRARRFPWNPLAVFDDGVHCYIKLPPRAAHRDAPVLFALGEDGSKTVLNYSVSNDTYVTDRVFRAAVLVLGEGGTGQILRMDNTRYEAPLDAGTDGPPAPTRTTESGSLTP